MRPTSEDYARVDAIDAKLAQLDPIIERFCDRNGLRFDKRREMRLWPGRRMWVREEVDRSLYLVMDLTVAEAMDRGFYPEMPWSLETSASSQGQPAHLLSTVIFRNIPFSRLNAVLEKGLEEGLACLRTQTREAVITKGAAIGAPPLSGEEEANLSAVAAKLAEFDSVIQRFCARTGTSLLPFGSHSLFRGISVDAGGHIYLRIDSSVPEIMKRGFHSEMSCSLEIYSGQTNQASHRGVLQAIPYSRLADVLEKGLEDCLSLIRESAGTQDSGKVGEI